MNTTCVNTSERLYGATAEVSAVDALSAKVFNSFNGLANLLATWQRRIENRQHLLQLDERLLRDIGISRYDAAKEAAKPFWKN